MTRNNFHGDLFDQMFGDDRPRKQLRQRVSQEAPRANPTTNRNIHASDEAGIDPSDLDDLPWNDDDQVIADVMSAAGM